MSKLKMPSSFLIITFMTTILVISNVVVFVSLFSGFNVVDLHDEIVRYDHSFVSFKVTYNVGPLDGTISAVLIAVSASHANFDTTVRIYYDEEYPFSWIYSHWAWRSFVDELKIQLQQRGISAEIIDAIRFAEIVQRNIKTIIVVPNGVLPSTVYKGEQYPCNPINQWLISGGVLIWIGDTIGSRIGHRGKLISNVNLLDGPKNVMGRDYGIDVGNSRKNTLTQNRTLFAAALDLRYPLVTRGTQLHEVIKYGGLPLGFTYTDGYNRTFVSISIVPVVNGTGRVIIFGDGYDDFDDAIGIVVTASDVAKIVFSEVFMYNEYYTPLISFKVYSVSGKGTIVDKFNCSGNDLWKDSKKNIKLLLIIYSKVMSIDTLYHKTWINLTE